MPSRPARPQLGLFDNPADAFRLDELTETVRALERQRPGRTAGELSRAVFAELAMKWTRRSAELVAEAIRLARAKEPHAEISGSQWQASTAEVRNWALNAGFEIRPMAASRSRRSRHTTRHIPTTRTEPHVNEDTNPQRAAEEKSGNATYPFTLLARHLIRAQLVPERVIPAAIGRHVRMLPFCTRGGERTADQPEKALRPPLRHLAYLDDYNFRRFGLPRG